MSTLHLFNMDALKSEFQDILRLQYEIHTRKSAILEKLQELKTVYSNLVKTNTKKIFLFCLDSFYFQYKTLLLETEDFCKFVVLINNRMYGDYYKLYHIILMQISDLHMDSRGLFAEFSKKYTPYKEIEPFHEYKISDIMDLHSDILKLVGFMHAHYSGKEQNICEHSEKTCVGLSITSFMQTLEYENTLLREQIGLYVNYIRFFHASQKGYLTKLFHKVVSFQKEIEDDILVNYRGLHASSESSAGSIQNGEDESAKMIETVVLEKSEPTEIEILLREAEKTTGEVEETTASDVAVSEATVSEATVSEATESEATESEATESEATVSEAVEENHQPTQPVSEGSAAEPVV